MVRVTAGVRETDVAHTMKKFQDVRTGDNSQRTKKQVKENCVLLLHNASCLSKIDYPTPSKNLRSLLSEVQSRMPDIP